MTLEDASKLARELMNAHGLQHWKFAFDGAVQRLGQCDRRRRRITLSLYYAANQPEEEVRDTILHEIAHARTPSRYPAHGMEWKTECRRIGAKPKRCFDGVTPEGLPKPKWQAVCEKCGWTKLYRRCMKGIIACGPCCRKSGNGKYDAEYNLKWNPVDASASI